MKNLINDHIKQIKMGDEIMTYCKLWDSADNEDFPTHRVAVAKTRDESMAKFMEMEKKRQELIDSIRATFVK